ncbi:hypothetical protein UFOVP245_192 [uncultured Caudovirales phage]|uniref:Uncharacterized protein n=1 Tax=uncultured Caudovirales phage TaxID=2100421 RepID=A0A6J7WZU6_9CAUD|nr:hypothetical protein UFOVP245_192 [uncultured Caudovirales phage]
MSQGYFLIALGENYIDECDFLVDTIRKQGDMRPISLLIHPQDESYARDKGVYDQLIHFTPCDKLWDDSHTSFEKYCLYPRIYMNEYLPYDENITVDSDVLCQYNADNVWEHCSNSNKYVVMTGRHNDPNWHWGAIGEVSKSFGQHVPHVHGGFFYCRKSEQLNKFFAFCRYVFYEYDNFNCRRMFRGGKVDEIIFAIAHSHFGIMPVAFDQFPIMSFNYTQDVIIPSKLQTENNQNIQMSDYIPFIHMFDKMDGANFKSLYEKIMREEPK